MSFAYASRNLFSSVSLWRKLFSSRPGTYRKPTSRRSLGDKVRFRPTMDTLEERTLLNAAPVIDPLLDATLTSNQDTAQIAVVANDADGDALTYSAESAGTEAYFLDQNLNLRIAGSLAENTYGENERWIKGGPDWYIIKPDGSLTRWDGTAGQTTGEHIATLPVIFYHKPELLTNATRDDLVYQLDQTLNLSFAGDLYENNYGTGELWLKGGTSISGRTSPWYFLTPNGQLYEWDGTGQASGVLVAQLDPIYHEQIHKLYKAQPHELAINIDNNIITAGPSAGFIGDFVIQVSVSDGADTSRARVNVRVTNDNRPEMQNIADQRLDVGEVQKELPIIAFDADGDKLTYSTATSGTMAYFLHQTRNFVTRQSYSENWGGLNERWIEADNGWHFIKPNGDLVHWDGGNQATGETVAKLDPIVYQAPEMLTNARPENLAYQLHQRLGLTHTGDLWENWGGKGERWLQGSQPFLAQNKPWYFIQPNGELYWWNGANARADGILLAKLDPAYFDQIERLYEPSAADHVEVSIANAHIAEAVTLLIKDTGMIGDVYVKLTASDGIRDDSQIFKVTKRFALDSDNDGLLNREETEIWKVRFISTTGTVTLRDATSDPFNADTDGDGFTDGEEFAMKLNPADADTDGDGLTDFQEVRGYEIPGLGLVTTDPLNADTDNDKRSDGAEATEFWVVRVAGHDPYRVYSDPRDVDADVDGVVDGLERTSGTDPYKADTDGDTLGDLHEMVTDGFDPLRNEFTNEETTPRIVSAASTSNTTVSVFFNRPMANYAINAANYIIVQESVNPEVGALLVRSASFLAGDRTAVQLITASQNELNYVLTVAGITDLVGNQFDPPTVSVGGVVDPAKAKFPGTPGSGGDLVDSDGDGLTDNEEQRGWEVAVTLADGRVITREVTSNPFVKDTDGDGLTDGDEAAIGLDPRDKDTDDDQLQDEHEFNEVFSNPAKQDTDNDGISDGGEFNFFLTSPIFADTDGDQISDGDEIILANRNPRVADLPKVAIEVGEVNFGLDVRFTATTSKGEQRSETKSVESTLTQSESQQYSNTDSSSDEYFAKAGVEIGYNVGTAESKFSGSFTAETGYTGQWTSSFTSESAEETQKAYTESNETGLVLTQDETLTREIEGATMRIAVDVKSIGNISFNIRNLQITAFVQDPHNPGRLLPIATLVPEVADEDGFNLGPLVPQRGPLIFTNDYVFPSLVEDLMLDPRGLVFKVANYDIIDERERNFAFTSQEINDRTAPLVISFGGADTDGDGEGDFTERYLVATNAGRRIEDTNGDNVIDNNDRRIAFDAQGKAVGITLREALENIVGLKHYDEDITHASDLDAVELENSYSTRIIDGVETLWRVRGVSRDPGSSLKQWEVLASTGIDRSVDFGDRVLNPEAGISLAFVQDLDNDRVPAAWEYIYGTSDTKVDTDGDGLDDGEELFDGWKVDVVGKPTIKVFSSGARTDSDLDGISDFDERHNTIKIDVNNDGIKETFLAPLDPKNPDTDGDGVTDFDEINGYEIELRLGNGSTQTITRTTNPLNPDSDGDTVRDGDERTLGIDPTKDDRDKVLDDDGDGLTNFEEENLDHTITYTEVSTVAGEEGEEKTRTVKSAADDADSDNDGLNDKEERDLGTDPTKADTDGDGLTDTNEVRGVKLADGTTVFTDPLDADTDDDKRSDGDEATTSWKVEVAGKDTYEVYSDPTEADSDLDDLFDGAEFANKTDPAKFDTDGDKVGDGKEIGLGTNPLQTDQRVQISLTKVNVVNSGDPGDEGEFRGVIKIEINGQDKDNFFNLTTLDGTLEGKDWTSDSQTKAYTLTSEDSVRIHATGLYEEDDTSDNDEQEGVFEYKLGNIPLKSTTTTITANFAHGGQLVFHFSISAVS